MAMVFCRGCGKEIHESAKLCPHCGFQQLDSSGGSGNKNMWMAGVSSVLALLSALNWLTINNWTQDVKIGLWLFCVVSIVLSTVSLSQKHRGKILNFLSIVISVLTILMLIGKM